MKPRCFDCLTEDVTVKVIDEYGFEHWFCAVDWTAQQEFSERVHAMLADAIAQLQVPGPVPAAFRHGS